MQLNTVNTQGQAGSGVEVSDTAFAAPFNEALVHQVVVAYQAGGRAGSKAQKNRSAVAGGGSKPWRQKGTGRARAGTSRSPIWRGGGLAFPATPRDFSQKVNRKMHRAALRVILSELVRQERLKLVDSFEINEVKTKALATTLASLEVNDCLIVTAEADEKLALSARNLPNIETCAAAEINPVNLICYEHLLMTTGALKKIEEGLL